MTVSRRFAGRVAVVTGGGGGLGSVLVRGLVAEGARVVIADKDIATAGAVAEQLGPATIARRLDVRDADEWRTTIQAAEGCFGPVTALVHCAGAILVRTIEETTAADLEQQWSVNMLGTLLGTQAALPSMRAAGGGSVLILSSRAGLSGTAGMAAYAASKAAAANFARTAARELAPYGVRVNALAPGGIDTPMSRLIAPDGAAERFAQLPVSRIGRPDEVVPMALLLLCDEGSYISGQVISIDGGATA